MKTFNANGKLLLTGEYLVLDGAVALATPTKLGQSLIIESIKEAELIWESRDTNNSIWFQHRFSHFHKKIENNVIAERLRLILQQAKKQNPLFLERLGYKVTTKLTFPRNWGLGTSSTLIYLIAQWAKCNPFELLFKAFGGSGYDIACAGANSPIFYQLKTKEHPIFKPANFNPSFKNQLYFVYLGKKQDSKKGIQHYRSKTPITFQAIEKMSQFSTTFINSYALKDFEKLIVEHEKFISQLIGMKTAKSIYFSDYWGSIKSLGAWGGDFVLVTSEKSTAETKKYFNEKGFSVFLNYEDLIL